MSSNTLRTNEFGDTDDGIDLERSSTEQTTDERGDLDFWRNTKGYTNISVEVDGEKYLLSLHELNALASGFGLTEVKDRDTQIHHLIPIPAKFGIKLDAPGAVEPMPKSDHKSLDHDSDAEDIEETLVDVFGEHCQEG